MRRRLLLLACLCLAALSARGGDAEEYRLKAAYLYNFISFTEWPAGQGGPLQVCVYGPDPFGEHLDRLAARGVGGRPLVPRRLSSARDLAQCQVVFISRDVAGNLARVFDHIEGRPVLTVADTPGLAAQGVMLNLDLDQGRVGFEANLGSVQAAGLRLSSKVLRLASRVYR